MKNGLITEARFRSRGQQHRKRGRGQAAGSEGQREGKRGGEIRRDRRTNEGENVGKSAIRRVALGREARRRETLASGRVWENISAVP